MAPTAQADYDARYAQPTGQGPASTMEFPPSQRTLGEYTGYYRELLSFLTAKLRCPHEAADVVQEVFARLFALENPDLIRQPRAFLYRIARNLALDSKRKSSVRNRFLIDLGELEDAPSAGPLPDHLVEGSQLRRALDQTIADMPRRRRDVFVLYRFAGMKQTEIAEKLGISTTMVERHLMKAMAQCRQQLQSHR
ncbi:MAG: RNA polymerase sigma factor [Nitrospira sp.]|nr:RNA polymerase sigma factor [Nitrospira sp.]